MYYYELFQQKPILAIIVILVSLTSTIIGYGAFPFIFARVRKKPITKRKYKILCYTFNIIVFFVFSALRGNPSTGAPYLLWTSLFAHFGAGRLISKGLMEKDKPKKERPVEKEYYRASNFTTIRVTACKSCGYRDKNDFTSCPACGKTKTEYFYVKERKKSE